MENKLPETFKTHEVFNQSTALENYNPVDFDLGIRSGVLCYHGSWEVISKHGKRMKLVNPLLFQD